MKNSEHTFSKLEVLINLVANRIDSAVQALDRLGAHEAALVLNSVDEITEDEFNSRFWKSVERTAIKADRESRFVQRIREDGHPHSPVIRGWLKEMDDR